MRSVKVEDGYVPATIKCPNCCIANLMQFNGIDSVSTKCQACDTEYTVIDYTIEVKPRDVAIKAVAESDIPF